MSRGYLLLAMIPALALGYGLCKGQTQLVRERPMLPLNFNHQLHGKVNCLTCHHDYADHAPSPPSGDRSCLLCHKKTADLALRIEEDFHTLCRDCHLQQSRTIHASGPVRECQRCHVAQVVELIR